MRLRARLYAFSFSDEFGPLYAIYPLWFADCGLSIAQISIVYIVWGASELLAEIPSGALADVVDRRRLIAFALGLRALGMALWLWWPTFWGALVGAALFAVHSAFASGAWEALVYDELKAAGDEDAYAPVMARSGQARNAATALGMLGAAGLIHLGVSFLHIGWVTLALCAPSVVLVLGLPRAAPELEGDAQGFRAWARVLAQGARDARADARSFKLVLLGAILGGLFIVDEYVHLLARHRGAAEFSIPLIVAAVWGGLLIGGEVAARAPRMKPATLGALLSVGSAIMVVGFLLQSAWPLLLVAVGYGALQTAWVISDARFQAHIPASTRATVTSIRAFGSGLVSVAALSLIGLLSVAEDPTRGLLVVVTALGLAGWLVRSWVPTSEVTSKGQSGAAHGTKPS